VPGSPAVTQTLLLVLRAWQPGGSSMVTPSASTTSLGGERRRISDVGQVSRPHRSPPVGPWGGCSGSFLQQLAGMGGGGSSGGGGGGSCGGDSGGGSGDGFVPSARRSQEPEGPGPRRGWAMKRQPQEARAVELWRCQDGALHAVVARPSALSRRRR